LPDHFTTSVIQIVYILQLFTLLTLNVQRVFRHLNCPIISRFRFRFGSFKNVKYV